LTTQHQYFDIPTPSGNGTKDTNYVETSYGYDSLGQRDRVVAPGGTITRTVYDALGQPISIWIGTDDVPTTGDWSPDNNSGANMVKVVEYVYDNNQAGGNSNRTKVIRPVDGTESNDRETEYFYDWRDRLVFVVDAERFTDEGQTCALYTRFELDNLGRKKKIERYYDEDADYATFTTSSAGLTVRLSKRSTGRPALPTTPSKATPGSTPGETPSNKKHPTPRNSSSEPSTGWDG